MHAFRGKDFDDGPLRLKVISNIPRVPRGWIPSPSFIDCIYLIVKLTYKVNIPFFRENVGLHWSSISSFLRSGKLITTCALVLIGLESP